ncbi:hypothetical protein JW865_09300 [Candidatus Bathyarchaeota archaeon]|nr:hypothetical protein [Candidatus Bathyarchaeota archaeon]
MIRRDLKKEKTQLNKFSHEKQITRPKILTNVCPFPPEIDPSRQKLYNSIPDNSSQRRPQLFLVVSFFAVMLLVYTVVYCGSNYMFLTLTGGFLVVLVLQYVYHYFNRFPEAFD